MRHTAHNAKGRCEIDDAYDQVKTTYEEVPFSSEERRVEATKVPHPFLEDLPEILHQYIMPVELIKPKVESRAIRRGNAFVQMTPNRKHVREFRQAAEEIGKIMTGETSMDDVPPVVADYGLGDYVPSRKLGRPRKADRVAAPPRPAVPPAIRTFEELKSPLPQPITNKTGSLSIEQYADMIKVARSHGVSKLKFRDLELEFYPDHGELGPKDDVDLPKTQIPPMSPASDTKPAVDQDLLEDMRRTQLLLDDPMAFEQEMITAHLEGEK